MPEEPPQTPGETPEENAEEKDLAKRGAEFLQPSRGRNPIPRVVSLIVLIGVLVLTALLFFRVMALFLVPLFLAGVLVVVFEPVFKWFVHRLNERTWLAALATTAVILLSVMAPCGFLAWRAFSEISHIIVSQQEELPNRAEIERALNGGPPLEEENRSIWERFDDPPKGSAVATTAAWYEWATRRKLDNREVTAIRSKAFSIATDQGLHTVVGGVQAIGAFLLGLGVMTVAVYYFFADGPTMVNTIMHLSPLDDVYEKELLERFAEVSRAVVLATVLSATVQGLLAGVGYWVAFWVTGVQGWPLILLTVLTMVMAMVPFVGAMSVWAVVAVCLFVNDHTGAAIGLAIYGAAIVSSADNVIKPFVLHGQSNLHPLLALLSVLGGVTVLGPIGILVGPMLVAFLQALLSMLRKELDLLENDPESNESSDTTTHSKRPPQTKKRSPKKRRGKRR